MQENRSTPSGRRGLLALLVLIGCILLVQDGAAREYSTEVRVSDEEELRQLYYDDLLDEEDFYLLLGLLENPVDLNRSERGDVYQLPGVSASLAEAIVDERVRNGPYLLLADLQQRVPEVTWRLIAQIEPFVVVSMPKGTSPAARGSINYFLYRSFDGCEPIEDDYPARSHRICNLGYDKMPAMALGGGAEVMGWLDFGLSGIAHEGIKYAVYEPSSRDIYAAWGVPLFRPHAAYVRIRRPHGTVVAGSYQADFGHGLVMSTSSGRDRHGFTVRRTLGSGSQDRIRAFDGLFGAAARAHSVRVGRAEFDLSVFGSVRSYDLYSSYLGLADGVQLDPVTAEVDGPRIWLDGKRTSYLTLPNVFRVAMAGGNATVRFNRRTHFGVTGYGAYLDRRVLEGVTDPHTFLIETRWPSSPGFGAIGVDGSFGFGLLDLSGEMGIWLEGESPAMALYFRAEVEPAWGHFILSLRHYDVGYGNPYTKAESNPDALGGHRARNEDGLRFKVTLKPLRQLRAQASIDIGHNILFDAYDARFRASIHGRPVDFLQISAFTTATNQNLAVNGRQHRYGGSFDEELAGFYSDDVLLEQLDEQGGLVMERAGERYSVGGALRAEKKKVGYATIRYRRTWEDTGKEVEVSSQSCQLRMQQGHSVRFNGRLTPTKTTTIGGSVLYYDSDVQGGRGYGIHGDHAVFGYLQVEQKIARKVKFRLRGGVGRRLPDPPSACDQADDTGLPAAEVEYDPDDYDLRHFGELLFSMQVKF
ncbi:MAG: helix-hairpin-helix domain-containing protein [Myxococcota bacterium]|nr:helix-hairpin-helix domain-containing protein [Myxococcota bacterium]